MSSKTYSGVTEKQQEELPRLKRCVEDTFEVSRENNVRFHDFISLAFRSSISEEEAQDLEDLNRPIVECNLMSAPLNRLCGEYSKQQPSIYASASPDVDIDPMLIMFVEGYFRRMLEEAQNDNVQYEGYRQSLAGGFNVKSLRPDYTDDMSFHQDLKLELEPDPTLVGFDPLATKVTKCDAKFYFKLYPILEDDFQRDYPGSDTTKMSAGSGLKWSYTLGKKRVLILVDFYELKTKKATLVMLANDETMLKSVYEEKLILHKEEGNLEQAPIIKEERETDIKYFCRYTFTENEIVDYQETNYTMPHFVFCDGNSIKVRDGLGCQIKQFTIPYIYPAKGLQSLTNLAMQTLAYDISNMTMHKFAIAEEAIPTNPDFQDALRDVQQGDLLVSKAYTKADDKGNRLPLPPVTPVPRVALPPEVTNIYGSAMQTLNNILGTFNPDLGVNNSELSGISIIEGATQSNAAAMPYVVNDMLGLNQIAQLAIDLLPKYVKTPRTVPIINRKGEREYIKINQEGGIKVEYNPGDLHIRVEAGVNFAIAKHRAVQQIIALMKVSPPFDEFMNEEGLPILLDNMEFKGVDIVKDLAYKYLEKKKKAAEQNPPPAPPEQIEAQAKSDTAKAQLMNAKTNEVKAAADIKENKMKNVIAIANTINTKDANDTARLNALVDIGESRANLILKAADVAAEERRTDEMAKQELAHLILKKQNQEHQHLTDIINLVKKSGGQNENTTQA